MDDEIEAKSSGNVCTVNGLLDLVFSVLCTTDTYL